MLRYGHYGYCDPDKFTYIAGFPDAVISVYRHPIYSDAWWVRVVRGDGSTFLDVASNAPDCTVECVADHYYEQAIG